MLLFSRITVFLVSLLLLIGCDKPIDYQYLMAHPEDLHKKLEQCEKADYTLGCETVKKAAADFFSLVDERNNNPEAFGNKIMQEQARTAEMAERLAKADQQYQKLQGMLSDAARIQEEWSKIDSVKKAYTDEQQKLSVLLAVVAATTSQQ